MQSYLKTRPVFVQILLFVGMAMGVFMIFSLIGMAILSSITGISAFDVADISTWKAHPKMIVFVRGMPSEDCSINISLSIAEISSALE